MSSGSSSTEMLIMDVSRHSAVFGEDGSWLVRSRVGCPGPSACICTPEQRTDCFCLAERKGGQELQES